MRGVAVPVHSKEENVRRLIIILVTLAALTLAPSALAESGTWGGGSSAVSVDRTLIPLDPLGSKCKGAYVWRGFKVLAGWAFKYWLRADWCYNGRIITKFYARRWAECCLLSWDFKKHIGWQAVGGAGKQSAYRWTQGKFQQCLAWCFNTKTPWVSLRVYGSGGYQAAHGGT
jgi:hypothetical protein